VSHPETHRRPEAVLAAPGAPFAVERGEDGGLLYAGGPRTLKEFAEVTWAYGDRPFLIGDDGTLTYREFFAQACALACRLVDEYGLRPGERAGVAMGNHPEWQTAFWATQFAGLIAVPLNSWWTAEELAYALDDCTPRVLLVDAEVLPRIDGWRRRVGARVVTFRYDGPVTPGVQRYEDFGPADPLAAPPPVDPAPEDDATIIYTSGTTTGSPKGAVATQLAQAGAAVGPRYHAAAAALARGETPGRDASPVTLMTFPFFQAPAFSTLYATMAAGGSLVLMRSWDAGRALALIEEHGVTHYSGVPTLAAQLLDASERAEGDPLGRLVHLGTAGAAAPPGLAARLAARYGDRLELRTSYGLTETCGAVIACSGAEYREHPESVGRPAPAVEARVAGPDGESLPDGVAGELWLRGQPLMRGYWRDEKVTATVLTPDGWFRTGDVATLDEGRISIVDRIKDVVVHGGLNVYCAEVEAVLHAHPRVADAALVGVPHPVLGEEVAAVVRLRPGARVSAEELREYAGGRLASYKVPAHILFGEVPRDPSGKLLKRELRGPVAERVGRGGGRS
jgi:long-chain acyl-CoA synthetase